MGRAPLNGGKERVAHPSSDKTKSKPLYVCPGCSNHTYY
jgi:hypothetical protein